MSKRKKRSGRHRSRKRKDKHKKSHKKKGKDKAEIRKRASRKKKSAINDKNRRLKEKFKAQRRKQDIIFVIFIIIFAVSMFGGYFLYTMYWDTDDKKTNDLIETNNDDNGVPNNEDDHGDSNNIEWHIYNKGMSLSKSSNKPAMIDFYFDGCSWCEALDKNTYSDSRVIDKAKSFVSIKVDIYEENAYNGPVLANQYNVQGCPTIVFLNAQGNEVNRVGGYEDANKFLIDMDEALSKS